MPKKPPAACNPSAKPLDPRLVGQRVRVHLNLHNGCYVATWKGKVAGYAEALLLGDVTARVSPSGYERCRTERTRNVHAFLEGTLEVLGRADVPVGARRLSYNCLNGPPCFRFADGNCFVSAARVVALPGGLVWATQEVTESVPGVGG
jgi:hypothetical protein